jgi:hypothetical protein
MEEEASSIANYPLWRIPLSCADETKVRNQSHLSPHLLMPSCQGKSTSPCHLAQEKAPTLIICVPGRCLTIIKFILFQVLTLKPRNRCCALFGSQERGLSRLSSIPFHVRHSPRQMVRDGCDTVWKRLSMLMGNTSTLHEGNTDHVSYPSSSNHTTGTLDGKPTMPTRNSCFDCGVSNSRKFFANVLGFRWALVKGMEIMFQNLVFLLATLCLPQRRRVTILQACFPLLYPSHPPTTTWPMMMNLFPYAAEEACAIIKSHRELMTMPLRMRTTLSKNRIRATQDSE